MGKVLIMLPMLLRNRGLCASDNIKLGKRTGKLGDIFLQKKYIVSPTNTDNISLSRGKKINAKSKTFHPEMKKRKCLLAPPRGCR